MNLPSLPGGRFHTFLTVAGLTGAVAGYILLYTPMQKAAERNQQVTYHLSLAQQYRSDADRVNEEFAAAVDSAKKTGDVPSDERIAEMSGAVQNAAKTSKKHARLAKAHNAVVREHLDGTGADWFAGYSLVAIGGLFLAFGCHQWAEQEEKQRKLLELQIQALERDLGAPKQTEASDGEGESD